MYLTDSLRVEYGIYWTRRTDEQGRTIWTSAPDVGITIIREPKLFNLWFARRGRRYFFRTPVLRRAFRVAATHAAVEQRERQKRR